MNKKSPLGYALLLCLVALLPSCASNPGAEIGADGLVIPFVIEDGYMIVEATINKKSGKFIFDTGANVSLVPGARMSLPMLPAVGTIDGRLRLLSQYRVRSVEFVNGSVRASSWLVRHKMEFPAGAEGILGNGIFAGYWVEISFSRNEIILHEQFPESFERAFHSPLAVRARNQMNVTIDVDSREFAMAIDTGLPYALFFPGAIAEGMDAADLRLIESKGEIGDFYLIQTNSVSIMDREYSDKLIIGNSYLGARNAASKDIGLVGIEFMRHYDLLLDYRTIRPNLNNDNSEGMFYIPITPPEERDYGFYSFLDAAPEFGVIEIGCGCGCGGWEYGCCDGDIEIRSVLADSEAYELGLRPGALILRLDGDHHSSFPVEEVNAPLFLNAFTEFEAVIDGAEVVLRRER